MNIEQPLEPKGILLAYFKIIRKGQKKIVLCLLEEPKFVNSPVLKTDAFTASVG